MIHPLAHYLALLDSGRLLQELSVPVLVWNPPLPGMGENTGELTRPKEGPAEPTLKKGSHTVVFELASGTGDTLTIGRGSACGIQIRDDSVSRKHLGLAATVQGWAAMDLGSKNGTWIGTTRLPAPAAMTLADGARIQLGNVELFFMLPPSFQAYLTQVRGQVP
jgi:hypothetical protein